MTPLLALLIACAMANGQTQQIVFSAERFDENVTKVFSKGPSHLYLIRSDGTGFKQITKGDDEDVMPCLSGDGKHLLFWRGSKGSTPWSNSGYDLYSVKPDGTEIRRLNRQILGYPSVGQARAFERFGPSVLRSTGNTDRYVTHTLKHRMTFTFSRPLFNRSGEQFLAYQDERSHYGDDVTTLGNIATGRFRTVPAKYRQLSWIDNNLLLASVGHKTTFVILDSSLREIRRKEVRSDENNEGGDEMFSDSLANSYERSAYRLGDRDSLLITAHHQMSDGGYNNIYKVNMRLGLSKYVAPETIWAVAPDGHTFLSAVYSWVGEYKGMGAEKLGKLRIWNAEKLTFKPIGPRLMLCYGACFLPSN